MGELGLVRSRDSLAGPARRAAHALEGVQVVRIDDPYKTQLGPVKTLSQKQTAHISLRGVELGGGFGDRKQTRAFDLQILSRARNHFRYSEPQFRTEARAVWFSRLLPLAAAFLALRFAVTPQEETQ